MTFDSISQLEQYIRSKMVSSLDNVQDKIHDIIRDLIDEFYSEYTPMVHVRTYQFYNSLIESKILPTLNGYEASVYFDVSKLDHSIKSLYGYGTWANKGWSEQTILTTAMIGNAPHGGYEPAGGEGIWLKAVPIISVEAYEYLKDSLRKNGIPLG